MKRILFMTLLIAGMSSTLGAQNQQQRNDELEVEKLRIQAEERARAEAEQRNWDTRIFTVRYADPNLVNLALTMFRAQTMPNPQLRIISVRAPKEIMPAIEDAIKRLDVPAPASINSADLTVYILMASDQSDPGGTLPAPLQPVVTQLKSVLTYKSFQLIETLLARATNGDGLSVGGTLQGVRPEPRETTAYNLQVRRATIHNPDGKTPTLQLNGMMFSLGNVHINTAVDVPQGQQVVVGKATLVDRAFILVMSAKFSN